MIVIILFHRLARTCKENNQRIWTFITKLPRKDTKNIYENTGLSKFTNIELLALQGRSGQIPRDLVKLTTLQVLQHFTPTSAEATMLQNLTNLRELVVEYASITSTQQRVISLDDLLKNHSKLTSFSVVASELHSLSKLLAVPFITSINQCFSRLDPLSWTLLTRIQDLTLNELKSDYYTDNMCLSKLWSLTQLRKLSLSSTNQTAMETGISKLLNLEHLSIFAAKSKDYKKNYWILDYNELLDMRKLTCLSVMIVDMGEDMAHTFAKLTQLEHFDLLEINDTRYEIGIYSNLTNLKEVCLCVDIASSDRGLDVKNMTKIESITIPWCQNVSQLSHLKNLRELSLSHGNQDQHNGLLFLQDLPWLGDLSVAAEIIPSGGIVNFNGMTNLSYIHIYGADKAGVTKGTQILTLTLVKNKKYLTFSLRIYPLHEARSVTDEVIFIDLR
jgi:hypothetical protein